MSKDSEKVFISEIESLKELEERYSEGDLANIFLKVSLNRLSNYTKVDVVVVGAGPSGLTASYYLAKAGLKTVVLEKTLGIGGGIRGGGMLLPIAIVENGDASDFLVNTGVRVKQISEGLSYVDPTEAMIKIASKAIDEGVFIWPGIYVEDIITRLSDTGIVVRGVVINWSPIINSKWHVDPIMIESKAVLDATGHDADVVRILIKRYPRIEIEVPGMASMNIWKGEEEVIVRSGKLLEGLYTAGMSTAEVYHSHRMGPLLGGMILSAKKVSEEIINDLRS